MVAAVFGPGVAIASADPDEQQLSEISARHAVETCDTVARLPTDQGVNRAVALVLEMTDLPRWAAERVVGLAVRRSCPEYLPRVQQAIPNFS